MGSNNDDGEDGGGWSEVLARDEMAASLAEILVHPFILGLSDGSLPAAVFDEYLRQDALYLSTFARCLAALAAHAPVTSWAGVLARHSAEVVDGERALHARLLREVPGSGGLDSTAPNAAAAAYVEFLTASCCRGGAFHEGLAAVLPCYWIYRRVGEELARAAVPSPDARYRAWVEEYSDAEFARGVDELRGVLDAAARTLTAEQREAMRPLVRRAAGFEWRFWDAVWQQQQQQQM